MYRLYRYVSSLFLANSVDKIKVAIDVEVRAPVMYGQSSSISVPVGEYSIKTQKMKEVEDEKD